MNNRTLLIFSAVLSVFLIIFFALTKQEHLGVPFFLDQMAMENDHPIKFFYEGREKDAAGMSPRDYFLENQMNASTYVGPQYLEGDLKFKDHTGYMGIPIKNRPLRHPTPLALHLQGEINGDAWAEWAYEDLNRTGHF